MMSPVPAAAVETVLAASAEDPRWLEGIARGVFCLVWLVPLDAVARLFFPVMMMNVWHLGGAFWSRLTAALLAATLAGCGGYFLSLHNPADPETDPPSLTRGLVWVAILGWAVGELFYAYVHIAGPRVLGFRYFKYVLTARQAGELLALLGLCTLMVRLLRVTRRTLGDARTAGLRRTIILYMMLLVVAEAFATVATALQWLDYDERENLLHRLPAVLTPSACR